MPVMIYPFKTNFLANRNKIQGKKEVPRKTKIKEI